ncbi:hypothetical protein BG004_006708, partial [Podila humilis]
MSENQTVAAVTMALIDLQTKIGDLVKAIHGRYPSLTVSELGSGESAGGHHDIAVKSSAKNHPGEYVLPKIESKPLVLSAESL